MLSCTEIVLRRREKCEGTRINFWFTATLTQSAGSWVNATKQLIYVINSNPSLKYQSGIVNCRVTIQYY